VDLAALLAADDAALRRRFSHLYLPGRRVRYLRRNALVALGNAGGLEAVSVAAAHLRHADPLLRAHAAWALGALGGPEAGAALRQAAGREADPVVREEIASALGRAGAGPTDEGARRGGSVP